MKNISQKLISQKLLSNKYIFSIIIKYNLNKYKKIISVKG